MAKSEKGLARVEHKRTRQVCAEAGVSYTAVHSASLAEQVLGGHLTEETVREMVSRRTFRRVMGYVRSLQKKAAQP